MVSKHRKLIEKGIPIKEISEAARREKLGRPKITEMHYWWTRKPLITARTSILSILLSDKVTQDQFRKITKLDKGKKPFSYSYLDDELTFIEKEAMINYEVENLDDIKILDPFAGAGSIPLETLRCGLSIDVNDYNPVAWMLLNINLFYPRKYGKKLLSSLKSIFDDLYTFLEDSIGRFYPVTPNNQTTLGYWYAWVVNCPQCNRETPLVNNWKLGGFTRSTEKYFISPTISNGSLNYKIELGTKAPQGTVVRGKSRCVFCGTSINNKVIVNQIKTNPKEEMIAIGFRSPNTKGADFKIAKTKEKDFLLNKTEFTKYLNELNSFIPKTKIPIILMISRYLVTWDRIFFPRQLMLLGSIIKKSIEIVQTLQKEEGEEFGIAIAFYCSCLLAKLISRNAKIVYWDYSKNTVIPIMAYRKFAIFWDHFEVHPFEGGSGSLRGSMNDILKGAEELYNFSKKINHPKVKITNQSVLNLCKFNYYDIIITDPPYFDDVPYPEVSDLFYVWQRLLLENFILSKNLVWQNLSTPRDDDLSVNNKERPSEFVATGLNESFKVLNKLLKDNGELILFYAHKKLEVWEFVVNALLEAGFQIISTYPLITESLNNPMAVGRASIFSSILLYAKKRTTDKKGILEEITFEIEEKIYPRLNEFWEAGIRHTDLTCAAIGPILEIITSYSELRSKFGKINIMNILELASKHVIRYVLSQYNQSDLEYDALTAFFLYISIENESQSKNVIIPFDNAHILSKSLNVDLSLLKQQGIVDYGEITGNNRVIRLLGHDMRTRIDGTSLIDAIHRTMIAYNQSGIKSMQESLKKEPHSISEIKSALELLSRAENPPGNDGEVASKILAIQKNIRKADATLIDFLE